MVDEVDVPRSGTHKRSDDELRSANDFDVADQPIDRHDVVVPDPSPDIEKPVVESTEFKPPNSEDDVDAASRPETPPVENPQPPEQGVADTSDAVTGQPGEEQTDAPVRSGSAAAGAGRRNNLARTPALPACPTCSRCRAP